MILFKSSFSQLFFNDLYQGFRWFSLFYFSRWFSCRVSFETRSSSIRCTFIYLLRICQGFISVWLKIISDLSLVCHFSLQFIKSILCWFCTCLFCFLSMNSYSKQCYNLTDDCLSLCRSFFDRLVGSTFSLDAEDYV